MLEHHRLLIAGRSNAAPSTFRWHVMDPSTGLLVGFAAWQPTDSWCWLSRFGVRRLEVHEAEDEPLLFTAQPGWLRKRRWQICDADGKHVGTIRPGAIHDASGGF